MKEQRWYTRKDGVIHVHNQPTLEQSQYSSVLFSESDLTYYRNNFNLKKAW